jgi:phosphoenolpyruvate carboxylase
MPFDPAQFRANAWNSLSQSEAAAARDPLASGVRILAIEIWDQLARGSLTRDMLRRAAKHISDEALRRRAERLAARMDEAPARDRTARAFALLKDASFDEVRTALERTRVSAVFTAHPTFAMSRKMRDAAAAMALGEGADISELAHAPDKSITLDDEHQDVQRAILAAQDANRALIAASIDWIQERHPARWRDVIPAPVGLATWVGYDLDGRTDIHWSASFLLRLKEKASQLLRYAGQARRAGAEGIAARLEAASREVTEQVALFAGDLDDPERVVAAANRLTEPKPENLVSLNAIIDETGALIKAADDDAQAKALSILRSEMRLYGLGVARIHLRVNAAQIRSALRADLNLAEGQDFLDRRALEEAAKKTTGANKKRINFASIFSEKMTARRQLMLSAQFLKHVDADAPIRFLIAEVEAPATVMGAIYLARLYGIDRMVDISPLFETPDALERGGRFIERLLEEKAYLDYIRGRGRISIQLGFSDSGRFMGQAAAALAIERLHILVARTLKKKDITDVEVLVFNTHGESMGRGGFPGSLKERFDHLITPWTRAKFARENLRLNTECSFQGGDGFLLFHTPRLAASTLGALFEWSWLPVARDESDAFYADINYSWDIYRAIKGWQESLFADTHYLQVLSAFAPNLLPVTGSRKSRRQSGASTGDIARSLRAIPHNAILQQLAAPANVFGGVGAAAAREPERFVRYVQGSPRMQGIFKLAGAARALTSLSILRSYESLFDPGFWTVRAARMDRSEEAEASRLVAERLAARGLDISLNRLANRLSVDRQAFDAVARHLAVSPSKDALFDKDLYALHAIRMALIVDALSLVAKIPGFSPRHELARETLLDYALELRFTEIAAMLADIFPESERRPESFANLSEAADAEEGPSGYPEIRRDIAAPLIEIEHAIKEIAVGVSHFYDAWG